MTSCSIPGRPIIWPRSSKSGGKLGLAWVELSTGRFSLTGLYATRAGRRAGAAQPGRDLDLRAEPRCPLGPRLTEPVGDGAHGSPVVGFPSRSRRATTLFDQFKTKTLAGFGIDDRSLEVQAAGALLAYLRETQKTSLGHITRLIPFRRADTLALDEMTRRSLELVRTLREGKREGSLLQRDRLLGDPDGCAAACPNGSRRR